MPRATSQADARVDVILHDQWGRPWHATLEKETMAPCGPISPQFHAPFIPDQKYLKPGGKNNPVRLTVDLVSLERDLQEAHEQRERDIRTLTVRHFPGWKQKAPPIEVLEKVDGAGHGPIPLEIVWAMMQGNRWILGFTQARPDWSRKGDVGAYFDPPATERQRRKMETEFADVDGEGAEPVPALVDADVAPFDPRGLQGVPEGVSVGVGGEHPSWAGTLEEFAIPQPQTSVRNPAARKE